MIDQLIEQLKEDEGYVRHAYQDTRGYWTIGYGRLIDKKLRGGITEPEASQLLVNDVSNAIADLDRELPWWRTLDPIRQQVLANMAFNLGITKLLKFKRTLEALRTGDIPGVVEGMRNSAWYDQVGDRSEKLVQMMRTGTQEA